MFLRDMSNHNLTFWQKLKLFPAACAEFLQRPKTRFDLRDRGLALVYFVVVVLVLQYCVRWMLEE